MATASTRPLSIVAIGAHQDDCWLALGATALLASRAGHRVTFITAVTDYRYLPYLAGRDAEVKAFHRSHAAKAGIGLIDLGHDYLRVKNTPELVQQLVDALAELRPDIVFCHDVNESNPDHVEIGHASLIASRYSEVFRPAGQDLGYPEVYWFSTGWQSYGFRGDVSVDVTKTIFDALRVISAIDDMTANGAPSTIATFSDPGIGGDPLALSSHARHKLAQCILDAGGGGYLESFRSAAGPVALDRRRLMRALVPPLALPLALPEAAP
ncbi:MAG: PIG-L family deacetylase [Planctomycetes bacterium]|nr:PIG-L family deacetylase [Planctomycetota bacterium]